ncbi:MAG: hypothetical protein HRU14_02015 [Planctomycetes bacterium]|nr:hypothetical protein [Planctomycetota bacterium]
MNSSSSPILVVIALVAGCASPPSARPVGYVPQVSDPVAAIEQRLREAGPLIRSMAAEGNVGSVSAARVETIAREIAALMGDAGFAPWPVTQAHLRTRVLFLVDDDADTRTDALAECRALLDDLKAKIARKRGHP